MRVDASLRDWIRGGAWMKMRKSKENNNAEYMFSTRYIEPTSRAQWSSRFGEEVVRTLLEQRGERVWRPSPFKGLVPDWETEDAYY